MNNNLEEKLKELKKGYMEKLKILVVTLKDLSDNLEQLDINDLYSKVHTISGTSGMYGLKELSDISTNFELYLKEIKNGNENLNKTELKEKLTEYINNIEIVVLEGL